MNEETNTITEESQVVAKQPETNAPKLGGATGKGWLPGQSGNPRGRLKKEETLISLLKDELEKVPAKERRGRTNAQLISIKLTEMARGGSLKAIKEIYDRICGKPKQSVEVGNLDGSPFATSSVDMSKLSAQELLNLLELAERAALNDSDTLDNIGPAEPGSNT